jgi:hypothetical protein
MNRKILVIFLVLSCVLIFGNSQALAGTPPPCEPIATMLASGLGEFVVGSTIGPDSALYIPEGISGRIWRVDPQTGEVTTFANGLPKALVGFGGTMDVAFIDDTAYALVTAVGPDFGGSDVVGLYRVDGPTSFTVIADIGAWSIAHPPVPAFSVPSGIQYALQPYKGGFLVTDGHHNRVLEITLDGKVSELIAFGNTVPTGLEVRGNTVFMAEAGPIPHLPEDGKVITFKAKSPTAVEVASGARLLVDVEFGPGRRLYALSQGIWPEGSFEGAPALPNTGSLVKVNRDGTFTAIINGLDRPTSFEFIQNTAYMTTLTGEIWKIDGVSCPPYGGSR